MADRCLAWRLPDDEPGQTVGENVSVRPVGGNRVRSYLDVVAPDDVAETEIEAALTALWLELVADQAAPSGPGEALPNPVVYRHGRVVLRFGTDFGTEDPALELAELRRFVDPATAEWHAPVRP